jgi:ribose transport system permease protein
MKIKDKLSSRNFWLSNSLYILVVLFIIVFSIANPKFFVAKNLINILTQSSTLIIVSIGMTLALITKGIDMSVGSIIFVCAATMQVLNKTTGAGIVAMMIVSLVVGLIAGLVNGLIVASLKVYPLLPTLATMYSFRGIGLVICGGGSSTMPLMWAKINSVKLFGIIPLHVLIAIALAALMQVFLKETTIGRHIYAVGDSEETSYKKGINVFRIKLLVYTLSGLMCGIAAIISSAQSMSVPISLGEGQEFNAIIASVLGGASLFGGRGSTMPGVIIGVLILSLISNVLVILGASAYLYTVVYAIVIFVVVLLDSPVLRKKHA